MASGSLLIVGATGDVGRGIVAAALESGRNVVASGRDEGKLARLADQHAGAPLRCIAGDLASEARAAELWEKAEACFGSIDAVAVSVNAAKRTAPLESSDAGELAAAYAADVLTHFNAAKAMLPRLGDSGLLIGIGGGTADFIFPGMSHVSMAQAALRMMYRGLAKERKSGAELRELLIVSMVAGESNRDTAPADWLTDLEVGRHVCAILDDPARFAKPIQHLRSRAQVGHPEVEAGT